MIAELITTISSKIANKNGAGQTVVIDCKGLGGKANRLEVFGQAGVFSRPPKGTSGVAVAIGREKIVLAMHNYQVVIDWTEDGETTIFSTTADGATVKARIDLKADGNIYLNGTSKYLVTWGALNSALATLVSAINTKFGTKLDGGGAVGTLTLDLTSAKATTLRTDG